MKKILPIIILMSFYFSGCASIESRKDASCRRGYYEGVKGDIDSIQHPSGFMNIVPSPVVIILSIIDFPLSFILDTVCLPYDASHQCKGIEEINNQKETDGINNDMVGGPGDGCANPSTVYAGSQGYPMKTVYSPGGESADVIFPDNTTCDEWAFFSGKCGQKWSYCEQHDGKIKNIAERDDRYLHSSFAVCVFSDGSECLEDDYYKGSCKPGQKYNIQNQSF